MPTTIETLAVEIVALRDKLDSTIKGGVRDAKEQLGKVEKPVVLKAKTGGFVSSISRAVGKATKLMAIGGVAAAAAFGFAAVKGAADFEAGMREVNTLLGESEEEFQALSKEVLNLSKDLGIDAVESTKALYQALSAGIPEENALTFMEIAAKAAIGGVTDTMTAVDGLTTVLNAFKIPASEAEHVADVMFTTVKQGKTTFDELAASMFQVAPMAAAANVSFEEVSAALATLTKQGTPTRVATTQLRASIQGLLKPSEEMDEIFQALGFDSAALALESKGLQFSLDAVRDATDGDVGAMTKLLGSIEATNAALGITGPNAETFAADFAAIGDAAGASQKAFEEMDKGFQRSMQRLKASFNFIRISVGSRLLPPLATAATWLAKRLPDGFERLSKFITKFSKIAKKILLPPLKLVLQAFKGLLKWFKDMVNPTRRIQQLLDYFSVPLANLALALGLNEDAFATLGQTWDTLTKAGNDLIQGVLDYFSVPLANLALSLGYTEDAFSDLAIIWETLTDIAERTISVVKSVVQYIWELAKALGLVFIESKIRQWRFFYDQIVKPLAGALGELVRHFRGFGEIKGPSPEVVALLSTMLEVWVGFLLAKKVVTLTQNIVHLGGTFIRKVGDWGHTITQTVKTVGTFIKRVFDWGQTITQTIVRRLAVPGVGWITDFADKTQTITQRVVGKIAVPTPVALLTSIAAGFTGGLAVAFGKAFLAAPFVTAIAGAIAAAFAAITAPVWVAIAAIIAVALAVPLIIIFRKQIGNFFSKTLPKLLKKWLAWLLKFWGQQIGFLTALTLAAFVLLIKGIILLFMQALPELFGLFVDLQQRLNRLWSEILSFIRDVAKKIPNLFTNLPGQIADFFKVLPGLIADIFTVEIPKLFRALPSFFGDAVANIPNLFKAVFVTLPKLVWTWLKKIWDRVKKTPVGKAIKFVWDQIKKGFKEGWEFVNKLTKGALADLVDTIRGVWQKFRDAAIFLINWFWRGIQAAWTTVTNWAKNVGSEIAGFITGALEVVWAAGWMLIWKLWQGIRDAWLWVSTLIVASFNQIADWLPDLWDAGREVFFSLWNGMKSVWSNTVLPWLQDVGKRIFDTLFGWVPGMSGGGTVGPTPVPPLEKILAGARGATVGLAQFGARATSGLRDFLVGEAGPELIRLPVGSRIFPRPSAAPAGVGGGFPSIEVNQTHVWNAEISEGQKQSLRDETRLSTLEGINDALGERLIGRSD